MSQAEITSITTRRALLRAAKAAPAAILPVVVAHASTILSLCHEFDALQIKKTALFDTITDDEAREWPINDIEDLQGPIVERLTELRATTPAEHRARARTLWFYIGKDQLNEDAASDLWDVRLTNAILRDLVAA